MASSMSPRSLLRPLRPVLIAGAAAVAWLSFSAPAADASTQPGPDTLLGGITAPAASAGHGTNNPGLTKQALKAVDSIAAAAQPDESAVTVLAAPSRAVPSGAAPAPAKYVPSVVSEIVAPAEAAAGTLTSSEVFPAQVTAPVVSLADTAVDRVVDTVSQSVVEPAAEAAPVLAAPLESVSEVVSRAPSLIEPLAPARAVLEEVDPAAAAIVPEALPGTPSLGSSNRAEGPMQSATPTADTARGGTGIRDGFSSVNSARPAVPGPALAAQSFLASYGNEGTPAGDDNRLSPLLPAPPAGSGSGNGQSSGGPFASAAWLGRPFEHLPPAGLLPVSGPLQHIPSPIALEPGSSPD
jgi:hypothetical protein